MPDGVPQSRLHEIVSAIKPTARAVMARFSLEHTSFPAFRTAGIHAVGVDIYNSEDSEQTIMDRMTAFVQNAEKNNLKTYILGVRTISMYTAALTEGFDYIAGHAISVVAKSAEDVSAFELDMPYLSLLDTARTSQH